MSEFDDLWRAAVRYRRASRELEWLLHDVHSAFRDPASLTSALERLLTFLASESGRTDANCSTTYYFITATEDAWRDAPEPLHAILDDMSGTLQDSIHAPQIARTFEATPEQLLARLKRA
ncbi:MAG: hypothetical protein ACLGH0_12740 [Thermoanaerobaculia bacterium]